MRSCPGPQRSVRPFVNFYDAAYCKRGEHGADADAVKRRVVGDAQKGAYRDQRNVVDVLHHRKRKLKHVGNSLHDSLDRRKNQPAFDAQKNAERGDEHRQEKAERAGDEREAEIRYEEVVKVRQQPECERQRNLKRVRQRYPLRQYALHGDENQITYNRGCPERNVINFRDGVHHGAERRYAQIVAYVQNDCGGDKIQPRYINYETFHRLTFVSQKARPSERRRPRRRN